MGKRKSSKKISHIITIRLFIAVFIAFLVSSVVTYFVLYVYCKDKAYGLLQYSGTAIGLDIQSNINTELYNYSLGAQLRQMYIDGGSEEDVTPLFSGTNYSYVAKRDGTIYISGNESFIGKNVRDIEYVSGMIDAGIEYIKQTGGYSSYEMTPLEVKTLDGNMDVYYLVSLCVEMPDSVVVEAYTKDSCEEIAVFVSESVSMNRNIGLTGFSIVINSDYEIVTQSAILKDAYRTRFPYMEILDRYKDGTDDSIEIFDYPLYIDGKTVDISTKMMFDRGVLWDTDYFYCLTEQLGSYILSLYPAEEALEQVNDTIFLIVIIEVVVFTVLFIVLSLLIKRRMVKKLDKINASLAEITNGNLEEKVDVRDSREFNTLSNDINATVNRLKEYIAEASARIDADLAVAKAIQSSALPSVFPPFPEHKEFEIFASMNTAKEVGGDFYDFYMLNDNTLGFLIADVSGKSIPGAMFMMTSKTVIKSLAESGIPPAEVFTLANKKLCQGNEAEMFVTAWLGYLDLKSGLVRVVNAGHNPPVLIHEDTAEYVRLKPSLVLAGMDGVKYKEQTVQLQKGDVLFLYTDGVTEAMNIDNKQYGEKRLKELLSFGSSDPVQSTEKSIGESICDMVTVDIKKFTEGAEQSDDITMLCIRYLGGKV